MLNKRVKRIICGVMLLTMIPKPSFAKVTDYLTTFNPSVGTYTINSLNPLSKAQETGTRIYVGISKGETYYLAGSVGSELYIRKGDNTLINNMGSNSIKSPIGTESLKELELTSLEKLQLAATINNADSSGFSLNDFDDSQIMRTFWKVDLQAWGSDNYESLVLRDFLIGSALRDLQNTQNMTDLDKCVDQVKSMGASINEITPVLKADEFSINNYQDLLEKISSIAGVATDNQQKIVIETQNKEIANSSIYDSNDFVSDCNIVRLITSKNPVTTGKFIEEAKVKFNVKSTDKLLEATVNDTNISAYERLAVQSLLYQRGSKYSYNNNSLPFELKTPTANNKNADDVTIASSLAKEVDDVLEKNKNATKEDEQMLLTTGLRGQFAFYAMQLNQDIPDCKAMQLSLSEGSGIADRSSNPLVMTKPDIKNFKYYVMLNNCVNEINYSSKVLVPVFGNIVTESSLKDKNLVNQLKILKSQYDLVVFLRDKAHALPEDFYKEVVKAWTTKVEITSGGEKKSLSEIYDTLCQLGTDFGKLGDYSAESDKPLSKFINMTDKTLCENLQYGIALSSTFVPFKTNVYEPATYKILTGNDDFFRFHERYGYYRKAVMIDTNVSSASELYTTNRTGTKKVCTLKDLLECEKDITLYPDTNFYNSDKMNEYMTQGLNLYSAVNKVTDKINNAKPSVTDSASKVVNGESSVTKEVIKSKVADDAASLWSKIVEAYELNVDDVLKTKGKEQYPTRLKNMKQYADSKSSKALSEIIDNAVLDGNQIDNYLSDDEDHTDNDYSVMRSFAFVSSIYRDSSLYDLVSVEGNKPIFISSKNLALVNSAPEYWKSTIFNYSLLKNSSVNRSINWTSSLDYNKPVYLDIYGNILTESGYVIVPISANATLNSSYDFLTAAFLSTYGENYSIPSKYEFIKDMDNANMFEENKDKKQWDFTNRSVNDVIDINKLSVASTETQSELFTLYADGLKDKINFNRYVANVFLEVVRGANPDNIDKDKEGLLLGSGRSENAMVQAAKLEDFKDTLTNYSQNNIISLPNIFYAEKIDYVIICLYVIAYILLLLAVIGYIVKLAYTYKLTLKSIGGVILTAGLVLGAFYAVPKLFYASYYSTNWFLLQDEAMKTSMLTMEKRESGLEVGVESTTSPKEQSKLLIKMKDVKIPWNEAFKKIIKSEYDEEQVNIVNKYASMDTAYGENNFEYMDEGLYITDEKLYNSTVVSLNTQWQVLTNTQLEEIPASFYTPYYYMLDTLIMNVNAYNDENKIHSWFTQTYRGKVKCLGLSKEYFMSDTFMDESNFDLLKLRPIYGRESLITKEAMYYDTSKLEQLQKSNWVNKSIGEDALNKRLYLLDLEARRFVMDNKELLGRISDESFLKAMALDLAIYHNKIFNCSSASSLELYKVSMDDINRLTVAPLNYVLQGSPYTYSRFIAEEVGEFGVYFAGALDCVDIAYGWVKPFSIIIIYITLIFSVFIYKLILRKPTSNWKGMLITVGLVCATNLCDALTLKFSIFMANHGVPSALCLAFQVIYRLQLIFFYLLLTYTVVTNWKDLGGTTIHDGFVLFADSFKDFGTRRFDNIEKNKESFGNKLYDKLKHRDDDKKEHLGKNTRSKLVRNNSNKFSNKKDNKTYGKDLLEEMKKK